MNEGQNEEYDKTFFEGICFKKMENPIKDDVELRIEGAMNAEVCVKIVKKVLENKDLEFECENCYFAKSVELPPPKVKEFLVREILVGLSSLVDGSLQGHQHYKESGGSQVGPETGLDSQCDK